jgi:hypothetical protein
MNIDVTTAIKCREDECSSLEMENPGIYNKPGIE